MKRLTLIRWDVAFPLSLCHRPGVRAEAEGQTESPLALHEKHLAEQRAELRFSKEVHDTHHSHSGVASGFGKRGKLSRIGSHGLQAAGAGSGTGPLF